MCDFIHTVSDHPWTSIFLAVVGLWAIQLIGQGITSIFHGHNPYEENEEED